jgi:hypothetical protein
MMRRQAVALLTVSLGGCSSADGRTGLVTMRDSAGVRIVENQAPDWSPKTAWTLEAEPVLDIGPEQTDSTPLFRVQDIIGIAGHLAVLNASSSEVLLFDSVGNLRRRIGRRGSGPGEFDQLRNLYRCGSDTLVVNDGSRISVFDSAGSFVRTQSVQSRSEDGLVRVRGVARDCSTFLLAGTISPVPAVGQVGRRSTLIFWGDLSGNARDTIGRLAGIEVATRDVQGRDLPVSLPWGVDGVSAVFGDRLYFGSTDRSEIRVLERSRGLVEAHRWRSQARPVTSEDRELYASKRDWLLQRNSGIKDVVPPLDQFPAVPSKLPEFRSILIDDEGNVWLRSYPAFIAGRPDLYDIDVPMRHSPPPGDEPELWLILDRSGRWLGSVQVPADLAVRSVYRSRVIGVWKDALDVEHVRVYRVRKPKRSD